MKYIRTKDRVCEFEMELLTMPDLIAVKGEGIGGFIRKEDIVKIADTIEELCDELVVVQKDFHDLLNADTHCLQTLKRYYEINKIEVLGIYGAIWTDKGLIYVAKMNEKGELELL